MGSKKRKKRQRSDPSATSTSIAAAQAAQMKERTAFTQETGLQVNRDGSVHHDDFSIDVHREAEPSLCAR
jgi:hypothetical protein